MDLDQFINCDTLRAFDKEIINKLTSILLEDVGEFDKYRDIINKRRTSHWFENYKMNTSPYTMRYSFWKWRRESGKQLRTNRPLNW